MIEISHVQIYCCSQQLDELIKSGDPVEQSKQIKYTDLIANAIMLHNVVDLTNVLNEMNAEGKETTKELVAGLSP